MPSQINIPPKAAQEFMHDLRLYFSETNMIKRDEIAARQRHLLLEHLPPRTKLRLPEIHELFLEMKSLA